MASKPGSIRSMTGYGEGSAQIGDLRWVCRLRSVNHRFLDLKIRLPRSDLPRLDAGIRGLLGKALERGAVDVSITPEVSGDSSSPGAKTYQINRDILQRYWSEAEAARKDLGFNRKAGLGLLLKLPGVIETKNPADSWTDWENQVPMILELLLQPALNSLCQNRGEEGLRLRHYLFSLLDQMDAALAQIELLEPKEKETLVKNLQTRLEEGMRRLVPNDPTMKQALEIALRQEAILWIERRGFEEERVRLRGHLDSIRQTLESSAAVGRKLEFQHQECLREVNTLGNKCQSLEISAHVIDLKSILEKFREQIANVE